MKEIAIVYVTNGYGKRLTENQTITRSTTVEAR